MWSERNRDPVKPVGVHKVMHEPLDRRPPGKQRRLPVILERQLCVLTHLTTQLIGSLLETQPTVTVTDNGDVTKS